MQRLILLVLAVFSLAASASAQQQPPDYAIRNIRHRFSDDNRQVIVEFEVYNLGGRTTQSATADFVILSTGQSLATATIDPLEAQEIVTVTLRFSTGSFPAGTTQSFRAAVGVNEVEQAGSDSIQNNFAQISITFPAQTGAPTQAPTPAITPTPLGASGTPIDNLLRQLGLDLTNPVDLAIVLGVAVTTLILLWVITIIVRLLFSSSPAFGAWQPPYAAIPPLDPNSVAGRRQSWQQYAQNSSLQAPCADGQMHVRKILLGMDGTNLAGWRVTAVRLSQYDMYGRVARSQTLAPGGLVKRLDRAARKARSNDMENARKWMRPVASGLVSRFKKKLNNRNALLPVALDVRLQGNHGEVRIIFELYQCQGGQWQKLDQWEPEMTVVGKAIHESYTFTVHGQRPDENAKTFRQRLQDDLIWVLADMLTTEAGHWMAQDTPSIATQPTGLPPIR